jgi:hypothetical protein
MVMTLVTAAEQVSDPAEEEPEVVLTPAVLVDEPGVLDCVDIEEEVRKPVDDESDTVVNVVGKLTKLEEDGLADKDKSLEVSVVLEKLEPESELLDEEDVDDASDVEVTLEDPELVYDVVCAVEVLESSEESELVCPTVVLESAELELD